MIGGEAGQQRLYDLITNLKKKVVKLEKKVKDLEETTFVLIQDLGVYITDSSIHNYPEQTVGAIDYTKDIDFIHKRIREQREEIDSIFNRCISGEITRARFIDLNDSATTQYLYFKQLKRKYHYGIKSESQNRIC